MVIFIKIIHLFPYFIDFYIFLGLSLKWDRKRIIQNIHVLISNYHQFGTQTDRKELTH